MNNFCEPVASPDGTLLAEFATCTRMAVRKVETGEILATSPTIRGDFFSPRFSRDNRFLGFFSIKKHPWNNLLERLPDFVQAGRLGYLDDGVEVVLMDLHSGAIYPGIQSTLRGGPFNTPQIRFIEPDSRLVSLSDEGMLLWSLPPTQRLFTPWAWLGLGCFVVLAGCWCWIGRGKTRPA